jgi:hypothetical protein
MEIALQDMRQILAAQLQPQNLHHRRNESPHAG